MSAEELVLSGVVWDIRVFMNFGTTPGVPLEFQLETTSSSGVMGKQGFLSTKQGSGLSSRDEGGKTGLF